MQIRILNHTYTIHGVDDPAHMLRLAEHVENRMAELQRATNTVDSHRLAVLAALHIADDLFRLEDRFQELDEFVSAKSQEFIRRLDRITG